MVAAVVGWWIWRRRKAAAAAQAEATPAVPEMAAGTGGGLPYYGGEMKPHGWTGMVEAPAWVDPVEVPAGTERVEAPGANTGLYEMPVDNRGWERRA